MPDGKRLVVKSISTSFANDSGALFQFVTLYSVQTQQFRQFFNPQAPGGGVYTVHENVLAYYDAGFQPRVQIVSTTNIEGGIEATLTGYYINLP